jgi:diguanylate cyclase (GGDEF)-like protein
LIVNTGFGRWLKKSDAAPAPSTPDEIMSLRRSRQALLDLANRADRGIFVHLPLWLLIGVWTDLHTQLTAFFWGNSVVFLANALARQELRRHFVALVKRDHRFANWLYMTLLLANCVHWGLLTAISMHWQPLQAAEFPLLFTMFAVGAFGTMGLSIMPFVRLWYPMTLLAPFVIALLMDLTPLHSMQALMSIVLVVYLYRATQVLHDDYWAAANARFELEERARQLELLSVTDALTQIHNRMYFEHRLIADWTRAARDGQPLSVVIIDLDHFKTINDTYGHLFGDRCLRTAAQALRTALHRGNDVLARYGGEEFAVLLPGADAASARKVAQRLLESVAGIQIEHPLGAVRLACSIGVSTSIPAALASPSSVVSDADRALYQAKQQGRNRVVVALSC